MYTYVCWRRHTPVTYNSLQTIVIHFLFFNCMKVAWEFFVEENFEWFSLILNSNKCHVDGNLCFPLKNIYTNKCWCLANWYAWNVSFECNWSWRIIFMNDLRLRHSVCHSVIYSIEIFGFFFLVFRKYWNI